MKLLAGLFLCGYVAVATAAECTRACSVLTDPDLVPCWQQSTEYFAQTLSKAIEDFAAINVHVSRWKQNHKEQSDKYAEFDHEIVNKTLDGMDFAGTTLSKEDLAEIYNLILNKTRKVEPNYEQEDELVELPHVECPVPCSYTVTMWIALFSVMIVVTFLTLLVTGAYLFTLHRMQKSPHSKPLVSTPS
ncbi:uncharacterized protein LOC106163176 [Lingula anatina]|uniref:Uncharacterized protein LOC106163176 n=1 Tax=Lingula anatina TaxID=7574 RepID=A0A1S3IE64_LINAN|nr:uncharacterized protein LOC106163176 [Lingula anatina]|eukprot:XP_013396146.1 uncharacterized protein LOC106163176 [Lingula anatina]